jgi:hypothetical protein
MNVDRHYETFACFCSLTLFVSSCPTNSFFPLPKVHPRRTTFEFSATLTFSPLGAVLFRGSPGVLPHLLFLN